MSDREGDDDGVLEAMAELFGEAPDRDPRDAPTEPNIDVGALFGGSGLPASPLRHPAASDRAPADPSAPGGDFGVERLPAGLTEQLFGPAPQAGAAPPPDAAPPADPPTPSGDLVADDPPAGDPPSEDLVADDPPSEDLLADDPPADDPPSEDLVADDPPSEDLVADDPPSEDLVADDPPADDPPSDDLVEADPPEADPERGGAVVDDPPGEVASDGAVADDRSESTPVAAGAAAAAAADGVGGSPLHELRRSPDDGRSAWWRIGYPVVIALALVAVPALVWLGKEAILDSTGGNLVERVEDPAAPGYEALTEATPTLLVVHQRADGSLGSASVLSLTGPEAGGVVVIPPDLVVDVDGQQGQGLAQAFAEGGADAVAALVEVELHAAMDDVRLVDDPGWASLTGPLGGLTVDNPDDVTVTTADGAVVTFERGELALAPEQVGAYLSAANEGESDVNRVLRIQRAWSAWLQGVASADDQAGAIPGELDSGLGRFVRDLAAAQVEVIPLPVQQLPLPGSEEVIFVGVGDEVARTVARLIPFPVGAPPGARLRVRLLDGTGRLDDGLPAVRPVVAQGGEVPTVGNAASFDLATTQLIYVDEARRAEVERLREALGVGEVLPSEEVGDAVDVTIILGADAEAALADGTFGTGLPATTSSAVAAPAADAAATPATEAVDGG